MKWEVTFKMATSCKSRIINPMTGKAGFTLVELMIALFVSALVMAAVISIYIAQTRSYSELDDVVNIQQDLRGALIILPLEIRLAGSDPTESNIPGIISASRTNFQFTMDIRGNAVTANNGDGDVNDTDENIAFGLGAGIDTLPIGGNGIVDGGNADWSTTSSLGRQTGGAGGYQPLADNIEALEFNYILDDGTTSLTPANPSQIRSVQVSILARADNPAQGFVNTATYTTASGAVWDPPNDNFRRRLVVTNIQCRNMGY